MNESNNHKSCKNYIIVRKTENLSINKNIYNIHVMPTNLNKIDAFG